VANHLSQLTPNCSRKIRCPFGVIVTARVASITGKRSAVLDAAFACRDAAQLGVLQGKHVTI
jgi:hypothetical protein